MKKYSIIFVLFLFACGGGSSSTPVILPQHDPIISDLSLYPSFAIVGDGSGAVQIEGDYLFSDADANITTCTINWYDTLGQSGTLTGTAGLYGYNSGAAFFTVTGDTTIPCTTTFEFYVTDITGLKSNKLTGTWTVYP